MTAGRRAGLVGYWVLPSLICLLVHWRGFQSWFRADDFAWLGLSLRVHNLHDLPAALFQPLAQGTIRPWSERAFFLAGYGLFGLNPLPFHIAIFATQFANLALAAAVGARVTGSRAAGWLAAVLWSIHSAAVEPLGWVCVYNQVLSAFFLLAAFYALLRFLETGQRRYEWLQWAAFLLGFGAQEGNLVYPALAAAWALTAARPYLKRTAPMFAVSGAYVALHLLAAPFARSGGYAMHFTGAVFRTLARYWTWSAGPSYSWMPFRIPAWVALVGAAVLTAGLGSFLWDRLRAGARPAAFCLAWYVVTIAPVLPLRDHRMEYYVFVPLIGICWLAGWGLAAAWSQGSRRRLAAAALAALYLALVLPRTLAASAWNYRVSLRARNLVESLARVGELHPGRTVLLAGVDDELFWNAIEDHASRLAGIDAVYLTPDPAAPAERAEFTLPPEVLGRGLDQGQVVVYDVRGPSLRNVTSAYASAPPSPGLPLRMDAGNLLEAYLLGPGWYDAEGGHRWMGRRAGLRLGAPPAAGSRLYLSGGRPDDRAITLTVCVNGLALAPVVLPPGQREFDAAVVLPASAAGQPEMRLLLEVSRTRRAPGDRRDLGLAFGRIEVR